MIGLAATLFLLFASLSLLSFGGGPAILPEMQRLVVTVHHWITAEQFSALFALAQAAPGPNLMVAPLIGWHVAGVAGVLAVTAAMFGPSSILTGVALHWWERHRDRPWRRPVQAGLAPVTTGLVIASAIIIGRGAAQSWGLAAITLGVIAITLGTKLHPLLALAAGALLGLAGIGRL